MIDLFEGMGNAKGDECVINQRASGHKAMTPHEAYGREALCGKADGKSRSEFEVMTRGEGL